MDLQHYDIAHYLGHKAMKHLYLAYRIYKVSITQALLENGINVIHMDLKKTSDIESEKSFRTVCDVSIDSVDPINAFHFSCNLRSLRQKEAEHCIDTSIYFQAMMEANINDVLGSKANGSFKKKWMTFLESNNASEDDIANFESYNENIYKKIRIPSIHAKDRKGLINIEALRFPYVHENIKKGWFVFVFLINKLHGSNVDYNDNWETMSFEINKIPAVINALDYPDYALIAEELSKYHLNHFDSIKKNKS